MNKIIILSLFLVCLVYMSTSLAASLMDPVVNEPKADSFSLTSADGKNISLDDFKGKFVLLNFWATWCAPCRKEMPSMSELHNQIKAKGFEVVGVHVGPSLAGVKKFLEAVPVDFTILIDKNMSLASWGVRGLPTTFLVNPDGNIIYKAIGEREWDSPDMIEFLNDIISSHGHMTERETLLILNKGSLFASLKKSIGWDNEKILPKQSLCELNNIP